MNGVSGHDYALARLYWAGDKRSLHNLLSYVDMVNSSCVVVQAVISAIVMLNDRCQTTHDNTDLFTSLYKRFLSQTFEVCAYMCCTTSDLQRF